MRMTMKPPPPMLPANGYVTASAKPVATAASTALPPRTMMSRPTRLAIESLLTTIACGAVVAAAPGWKRHDDGNVAGTRAGDVTSGVALTVVEPQAAVKMTAASETLALRIKEEMGIGVFGEQQILRFAQDDKRPRDNKGVI